MNRGGQGVNVKFGYPSLPSLNRQVPSNTAGRLIDSSET